MKKENPEVRIISSEPCEIRTIEGVKTFEGRSIVFNKESGNLGGFTELIKPEAITGVLEKSDIFVYLNHNRAKGVLARCRSGKGSMKYSVDSKGVKYQFEIPSFDLGNELIQGVQRGDISGSSFSFFVKEDKWTKRNDGSILRTVLKIEEITDMSPVYNEAYEDTTAAIRSLDLVTASNSFLPEDPEGNTVIEEIAEPLPAEIHERIITDQERRLRQLNKISKLKNNIK